MNNTSSDPNQDTNPPTPGQGANQNPSSGSTTQSNPNPADQNAGTTSNSNPASPLGGSTGDSLTDSLIIALTNENEALKSDIDQAKKQLDDMLKISQNALADLQNFRRRSEEEKNAFVEYANAGLIKSSVLPFLDNMHRALSHEPKDAEWAKGVEQSMELFEKALASQGLKAFDSVGQKLDPKIHQVLMTAPGEKDIVLQETEKGFMLGDKVLKPAKVIVGNGEAE